MNKTTKLILLVLATCTLFIYLGTSAGKTPYDYFTRLAQAFSRGKYWLTDNPSWLNELVPGPKGEYFTVYPPMPALLAIIPVLVLGNIFEQQWLAHILGIGASIIAASLFFKITRKDSIAIWGYILCSLGTINWYMSATGSVWLLGQISAEFFLLLAVWETLGKKRLFWIGLAIGAAYLSRLPTIVSLPFFIYLLKNKLFWSDDGLKLNLRNILAFVFPITGFIFFNFWYNYVRYGTFLDVGYIKIPGVLAEPWFSKGLFSTYYIGDHLRVIFGAMPKVLNKWPYIQPSWGGLAIWVTTPAFIYSLFANIKVKVVFWSWISIFAIALVDFSHGSTGFAQFGYRFAVDFYPFLFLITAHGLHKKLTKVSWLLLISGLVVNAWGVLWINKFGWIGY